MGLKRDPWNKGRTKNPTPVALVMRTHNRKCEDCRQMFNATAKDKMSRSADGGRFKCPGVPRASRGYRSAGLRNRLWQWKQDARTQAVRPVRSGELDRAIAQRDEAAGCNSIGELMGWADNTIEVQMIQEKQYAEFLASKAQYGADSGFTPTWIPNFLFDFQQPLTGWAIQKGRDAIFADCGLGKTLMQLVWAENVVRHTNKPVLILTPIAVSHQTVAEAEKFGIECRRTRTGEVHPGINVTNYERLHYFNPSDFAGVVCDESGILKNFDGVRRAQITEFMRTVPYRLLCTATAAPNDYIELGTSSEALGYLGYTDMLGRFFMNAQNTIKPMVYRNKGNDDGDGSLWRFKGHAETAFWCWVCSWARAVRKPSDIGFDDGKFILPPLTEEQHVVIPNQLAPGQLFAKPAVGLREQREERSRTVNERCEKAAALVADTGEQAIVWCHLNKEGDRLTSIIDGAVQVSGDDSEESKEETFRAFVSGEIRVMITKPKIGAWGLNLQNCNHMVSFPSHSFEQYYQSVRRCWRFGQKRTVKVDMVTTEGELDVMSNLQRKATAADKMFTELVKYMNDAIAVDGSLKFTKREEIPSWF